MKNSRPFNWQHFFLSTVHETHLKFYLSFLIGNSPYCTKSCYIEKSFKTFWDLFILRKYFNSFILRLLWILFLCLVINRELIPHIVNKRLSSINLLIPDTDVNFWHSYSVCSLCMMFILQLWPLRTLHSYLTTYIGLDMQLILTVLPFLLWGPVQQSFVLFLVQPNIGTIIQIRSSDWM